MMQAKTTIIKKWSCLKQRKVSQADIQHGLWDLIPLSWWMQYVNEHLNVCIVPPSPSSSPPVLLCFFFFFLASLLAWVAHRVHEGSLLMIARRKVGAGMSACAVMIVICNASVNMHNFEYGATSFVSCCVGLISIHVCVQMYADSIHSTQLSRCMHSSMLATCLCCMYLQMRHTHQMQHQSPHSI